MIDSFAFHLTAATVCLPLGFSLACIHAGFLRFVEIVTAAQDQPRKVSLCPSVVSCLKPYAQLARPF